MGSSKTSTVTLFCQLYHSRKPSNLHDESVNDIFRKQSLLIDLFHNIWVTARRFQSYSLVSFNLWRKEFFRTLNSNHLISIWFIESSKGFSEKLLLRKLLLGEQVTWRGRRIYQGLFNQVVSYVYTEYTFKHSGKPRVQSYRKTILTGNKNTYRWGFSLS